jgi:hypothetical protein
LQAVLDVTGPDGRPVADARKYKSKPGDPVVSFAAAETGDYQVAIHDAGYGGAPNFIYRLTLTTGPRTDAHFPLGGRRGEVVPLELVTRDGGSKKANFSLEHVEGSSVTRRVQSADGASLVVTLHVDDLPEVMERTPQTKDAEPVKLPALLNGRIDHAGEQDDWPVDLGNGQTVMFDVLAELLGSRLDSVLTLLDAEGKELAKNDDAADGQADSRFVFTAPRAGRYVLRIEDRHASRGGWDFGYRIRAPVVPKTDYELTIASGMINVIRDSDVKADLEEADAKKKPRPKGTGLKVDLVPLGNLTKDVVLEVTGLPEGVTAERTVVSAKQKSAEIFFNAVPQTKLQAARITVRGTSEIEGQQVVRPAVVKQSFGEPAAESVRLAVVPPVPFKHSGHYLVVNDQPAGTTMTKHFELDRGGFAGPLTVMLADRQGRCLQKVTGSPLVLPPGATEFDYTALYPPEVEIGHTSRIQLMLVGEMTDFDGSRHTISHTNFEQDNQMISVVSEGLLRITTSATSFVAAPNGSVTVPVKVHRDPKLAQSPVRLELELPRHMAGVSARGVELPAASSEGALRIDIGDRPGPLNMPVKIIAHAVGADGAPHSAEASIELVPASKR